MSRLRLLFIGESLVLAGAIELAQRRGHAIVGIFATVKAEATAMTAAGLPVEGPEGNVAAFLAAHECDALFSIINGHILDTADLARPRLAAINYHNAPLPTYAGLWATAWAVLNGETTHGITWHLMEPGIDTGAILAQRRFPLAPDETTASLNARCSAAAVESLGDVFNALEQGEVVGRPQNAAARTYHSRGDVAPHGGRIDWRQPAENIVRLVRACDWGLTASEFGKATLLTVDGSIAARSAELAAATAAPGTVIAVDGMWLTVACGKGAARLRLEQPTSTEVGAALPIQDLDRHGCVAAPAGSISVKACTVESSDHHRLPTIVQSIAALVEEDPNAPAIIAGHRVMSRAEVASQADAIAAALFAAGLHRDGGVGILLPAGSDFVAAALGAMRAGGAYVPLDPSSPLARHVVEIAEAGITHIVTRRSVDTADLPGVITIDLDSLMQAGGLPKLPEPAADDCAYRIFTSGSTGRPKAVEITHSALANLAAHYDAALPLSPNDRMTMLAHPTFDASVADIWPVLAAGGVLLIPPDRILLDGAGLIAWLATSRATCAFVPTAIAERLLDLPWPSNIALKTLLTGGDTLHRRPPAGMPFRFINTYGPTENTVDSLWAEVGAGSGRPVIGKAIAGVSTTVMNAAGEPAAPGELGELVLGGVQVARGYRGRPELTGDSFYFGGSDNQLRFYRTGDLVRLNDKGEFEFHGRIDDQLQLLGVRVEPGEIEALLRSDPRVAEVACLPLRADREVIGLLAYVVATAEHSSDGAVAYELRAMLAQRLPPAIIPKRIELRSELPRTVAGKIDRVALINEYNEVATSAGPAANDADPIGALWRSLASAAADAREDQSFWDLGGDSLGAIDLLAGVEKSSGVRVSIGLFLADPTLAGIRREIVTCRDPLVVRLREGAGPPLVLWYGVSGDLEHYQRLVAELGDREVIGIRSPGAADAAQVAENLEDAVASGLACLRRFGLFEAPAMLGYSWSGLLAFEAARQLSAVGTPPPFVGLVGTLPPFTRRGRAARLAHLARWGPVAAWRMISGRQRTPGRMRAGLMRLLRLLKSDGDLPVKPGWSRLPIHDIHLRMGQHYQPDPGPEVKFMLFRETGMRHRVDHLGYVRFDEPDLGWRRWAGVPPEVQWLEADHDSIMKGEPVTRLASLLRVKLEQVK